MTKKRKLAIAVNLFVGVMTFGAWLLMMLRAGAHGQLATEGLYNLKYFTVLSNLFNGVVVLLYAYWLLRNKTMTKGKRTLKLVATSAVGLTFLTVMGFLGPLYGYGSMFLGANFWFHLVLPVLSFISFIFLEEGEKIPFRYSGFAVLPTLVYSIGYLGNIGINGIGEWPNSNDFYGFLLWGNGVGAVIACACLLVTWLMAVVLGLCGRSFVRK